MEKFEAGEGCPFPHTLITDYNKSKSQTKFYHLYRHLLHMYLQARTKQFILQNKKASSLLSVEALLIYFSQ